MQQDRPLLATHLDRELEFLLAHREGRILLYRLVVELCHVFDVEYPHNAAAYSLLAKQEIGKKLLNACREVNPVQTQLAEREYWQLVEDSKKQQEDQHGE